jgi:hypothetical protein
VVWWSNVLQLSGLGLQVFGTVLTIRGLVQTWRAYPPDDPLVPAWGRAKARLGRFRVRARARLLGRRHLERAVAQSLGDIAEGVAYDATVVASDGLPVDRDAAIAELARRIHQLKVEVVKVDHEWRQAIDQVRSDLGLGLAKEAANRAAEIRAIATQGVRKAIGGLACIAVGIVLQGAAVFGAS